MTVARYKIFILATFFLLGAQCKQYSANYTLNSVCVSAENMSLGAVVCRTLSVQNCITSKKHILATRMRLPKLVFFQGLGLQKDLCF